MDTFQQKLAAGLQGEEIARVYLESLGHKVEDYPNISLLDQRSQDFRVNGTPTEVKIDIGSAKTGNVVIEHQSLKTHTAPWYIYILPTFYRVSKKDLEFIVDTWPDKVPMGDDKRQGTKLPIKSSVFNEYFHIIR